MVFRNSSPPYQYPSRQTESRSDSSSDLQCLGILLLAETPDVTFFASSRMKWFSVNLHVTHFITCESAESKCTRHARAATYIFSSTFIESAWPFVLFLTRPRVANLRFAFRNMSAFLTQPTNIEDKRAQISRNWAKFKGGTRAKTSRTRSGTFAVNRSWPSTFTRAPAHRSSQQSAIWPH